MNIAKYSLLVFISSLFFTACEDTLEEDALPETNTEDLIESQAQYFTQPGSPLIIDIFSSNVTFGSDFTVSIDQTTQLGNLEMMENSLLKYTPDVDAGTDFFVFTASSTQNDDSDTDTVTIDIGDPVIDSLCYPQAHYDCFFYDITQEPANWHLDVLLNDELCNGEIIDFDVFEGPQFGEVEVIDGDTSQYMYYNPGENFEGYDEFIYKVVLQFEVDDDSVYTRGSDEPITIYGLVNLFDVSGDTVDVGDSCLFAVEDYIALDSIANGDSTQSGPITIDVLANDELCGQQVLSLSILEPAIHGFAEVRNESDQNVIEYTPTDATVAIEYDFFLYQVCTESGCSLATVVIDYGLHDGGECITTAYDDLLWFAIDSTGTNDTLSVSVDVIWNDIVCDSSEYSVSIVQDPVNGTYTLSNTLFVYEPNPDYWEGADPATAQDVAIYNLCDGQNNCSEAAIIIGCE